ncbi:C-X-C motif chemokine 10-like [Pseudophryne corroboree]|uniref:C-X-C motif chemokine 10-like n=1 Tax=Pseudophryne corroboree TaxID=495146 RepID=UPI003081FAEF
MHTQCTTVIVCVLLLSATLIQGFAAPRGSRCKCKSLSKKLNTKKTIKLEIFPPSSTCDLEEYVATVKGAKKTKCVNPHIKEVKAILNGKLKNSKHIQVIRHSV